MAYDVTEERLKVKGSEQITRDLKVGRDLETTNSITIGSRLANCSVGNKSFAFGENVAASGNDSYAGGYRTSAIGYGSHAEGNCTYACGNYSHAEGWFSKACGLYSHAEGLGSIAKCCSAHAEGCCTCTNGDAAHAEGRETQASGSYSHAEGLCAHAGACTSHAEGYTTYAYGCSSHAEGCATTTCCNYSHAEGRESIADAPVSHVEGCRSITHGTASHAEGEYTEVNSRAGHVQGKYNYIDSLCCFADIVGGGDSTTRLNIEATDWNGNKFLKGDVFINANNDSTGGTALGATLTCKVDCSSVGVANGVASLDATGRVPYSQLPESAMEYKGTWDASTNTPSLADGIGTNGDFYVVSVAGTVNFGTVENPRNVTFYVNDRVIYDGATSQWARLPAGEVKSVNGMSGDVVLDATNINYNGNTTVKCAIDTAESNAKNLANATGTLGIAHGGTGATTAADARTCLGLGNVSTINTNNCTTQFLRGDGTWAAMAGGGTVTVSNQYSGEYPVALCTGTTSIGRSTNQSLLFDTSIGALTANIFCGKIKLSKTSTSVPLIAASSGTFVTDPGNLYRLQNSSDDSICGVYFDPTLGSLSTQSLYIRRATGYECACNQIITCGHCSFNCFMTCGCESRNVLASVGGDTRAYIIATGDLSTVCICSFGNYCEGDISIYAANRCSKSQVILSSDSTASSSSYSKSAMTVCSGNLIVCQTCSSALGGRKVFCFDDNGVLHLKCGAAIRFDL